MRAGKRITGRPEQFLKVWAWSGARATVSETRGSSHDAGVGVSINGGKWSGSGSATVAWSNDTSVSVPFTGNRFVGNSINYRKFILVCQKTWKRTEVAPTGLDALLPANLTRQSIPAPGFRHCAPYRKGTVYKVNHADNVTYGGGVGLGFVSLSAHAAMTHQTSEIFTMKKASAICGNNPNSLTDSTQIAATAR